MTSDGPEEAGFDHHLAQAAESSKSSKSCSRTCPRQRPSDEGPGGGNALSLVLLGSTPVIRLPDASRRSSVPDQGGRAMIDGLG